MVTEFVHFRCKTYFDEVSLWQRCLKNIVKWSNAFKLFDFKLFEYKTEPILILWSFIFSDFIIVCIFILYAAKSILPPSLHTMYWWSSESVTEEWGVQSWWRRWSQWWGPDCPARGDNRCQQSRHVTSRRSRRARRFWNGGHGDCEAQDAWPRPPDTFFKR